MGLTGYRPLTRAGLEAHHYHLEDGRGVARAELSAAAREGAEALELAPACRQVLHELVGVYGEKELNGKLLVWPSNAYLEMKTGLSERSIRYALRELIDLGLIGAKDSANGKRFGIRNQKGEIVDAYGFDLTPLYNRRGEFQTVLEQQKAIRSSLKRIHEQITVCRRAITEALLGLSLSFPDALRSDLEGELADLLQKTPRRNPKSSLEALEAVRTWWMDLRFKAEKRFYDAGNDGTDCRHIESNNGPSSNTCKKVIEDDHAPAEVPVDLVTSACPAHQTYYQEPIRSERELVAAAEYLRPVLGAHASAWSEAKELLGQVRAAAVLFMVLERYDRMPDAMKNPGGYFRAMARTVADRKINLALELMEMRRKNLQRGSSIP